MLLELINSLIICYVQPPPPPPTHSCLSSSRSASPSQTSPPLSIAQIFTEFLLSAPPPDRRSETLRLFRFISSPLIRPLLAAQLLCNFILSELVASFIGVSYHASAAAAAAAAAAATGSIGAAVTLATGASPEPPPTLPLTPSFLLTPPPPPPSPLPPPAAVCLPLSLIAYGCVLNAGRSFSSKTAGRF